MHPRAALVGGVLAALSCGPSGGSATSSASGTSPPVTTAAPLEASASARATAAATASDQGPAASLARGRALASQGKWKDATAAFREAAEAQAPSPMAFSELGWAAFQAGDLELASRATSQGLELATDPKPRAQMLYNRGRIEEARGDKPAAAKSYAESLTLRPNRTVEQRLAALGAPSPAPPPAPRVCDRSFATLREACDCLLGERAALGLPKDADGSCAPLPLEGGDPADRAIEVVRVAAGSESVAWALADVRGRLRPLGELEGREAKPLRILRPLEGRSDVVSVLYEVTSTEAAKTTRTTLELLCVLTDAPTCPLVVPHAIVELDEGRPDPQRTTTLARSVSKDGSVVVKKQAGPDDLVPPGALGKHALFR